MLWIKRAVAATSLTLLTMFAVTLPATVPDRVPTGAAQAAPPSGTIVFIKSHNVWLIRPDGSGLYQVTRDGTFGAPYVSPSMSDAGVIAAGRGPYIVRMKQNGQVLNRIDPHPLTNSVSHPIDGAPIQVAISPDGRRIAYTFASYSCPIGASCGLRTATGVTDSAALSPNRVGTNYFSSPSWITNSRLMVHGGYGSHVMVQDLAGAPAHWYDDSEVVDPGEDLSAGAVSRDGSRLAVVRSYGATTHLATASVAGDPRTAPVSGLADPTYLCFTNQDAAINSPSWGPDNRSVVIGDSDGLVILTEGAACASTGIRALAPGGSAPHWSPGTLNPGPRLFSPISTPRITGKARVGRKVTATTGAWSPKPSTVAYRWLRNGKAIKGKAGAKRTYVVRRTDRGRRLSVLVTVKRSGYSNAALRAATVLVRR
ncbi:LpqB family beta-propeller domain-containing protein [Nocardioides sp. Bht2]|uniref:LpqB family beta-propeller domain-containing protein n=1 Tax=Nocardioides sp. Bht2 TaxID=3392297 RepID=UPI0039B66328